MIFTVYKGNKKLGRIIAKDLEEAEKVANKKWKFWTDLYIKGKNNGWNHIYTNWLSLV